MHKWNPPLIPVIRKYASTHKRFTPKQIHEQVGYNQASISYQCLQLLREGFLVREQCPCGRGFVYKRWKY